MKELIKLLLKLLSLEDNLLLRKISYKSLIKKIFNLLLFITFKLLELNISKKVE